MGTSSQEGQGLTVNQARSSQVDWYRLPVAEIEARLDTALASGLTEAEVKRRLAQYGANEVQDHGGPGRWQILRRAADGRDDRRTGRGGSHFGGPGRHPRRAGHPGDRGPQCRAWATRRSIAPSSRWRRSSGMSAPTVRVRREHQVREVSARDLVPGDVVLLETGNVVPGRWTPG